MRLLVGMAVLAAVLPAAAARATLRGPEFMSAAGGGFAELYNLDFDAASATFNALAQRYPGHPGPPLYQAAVIWIRHLNGCHELSLNYFAHPGYFIRAAACPIDAAAHQRFVGLPGASRLRADRVLKGDPRDGDGRYYLGVAEGLAAAFAVTVDHSHLEAFRHAKQASAIHTRLLQESRTYFDACLLSGLFNYTAASLPWFLRWLAGGDKARGMESVSLAVISGTWASDDARLVRMVLLAREGHLADALADAESLWKQYPHNYLLHLAQAQILDRMGRSDDAGTTYLQILRMAEEGKPNYQQIGIAAFRWEVGNRLLASRPQSSLDLYQSLLADPATAERWRVLAALQSGCALDLLGRRDDAVRKYQAVLEMKDYDNSHSHAKEYLRTPFSAAGNSIALPRLSPR